MLIKNLGLVDYQTTLEQMQQFTAQRDANTADEIWFCEHPCVFTLGRHADPAHILDAHDIPIVRTDRGGQVTYHGPGQLMAYFLYDLKRKKMGIAAFVCQLEKSVITVLQSFGIKAMREKNKPGVYVQGAKICSIGLRVKNGLTYHGLALNISMDLTPFAYINPCGYEKMPVTQVADFSASVTVPEVQKKLTTAIRDM